MSHLVPVWYQSPTHSFTVTSLQTVASPLLTIHFSTTSAHFSITADQMQSQVGHLVPLWYQSPTHSYTMVSLQTVANPSLALHFSTSSVHFSITSVQLHRLNHQHSNLPQSIDISAVSVTLGRIGSRLVNGWTFTNVPQDQSASMPLNRDYCCQPCVGVLIVHCYTLTQ